MRILPSAFAALLVLGAVSTRAVADDWSDCKLSVPEKRIAACTRIINRHDEGPERIALARTYRGIAYRGRDNTERAIEDFSKAIELDSKRAAYNRGLVHATRGEHDQAIAQYDEAIRLDANDAAAYGARGAAFNTKGDRERAITEWNEAIRLDPKLASAYISRGNAYYNKGDRELAVVDAMDAIRLEPNLPGGYALRGIVYGAKGELDRAVADFTKAIELDPKAVNAYENRGTAFDKKGDLDKAMADFTKAIEINPKAYRAHDNRGVIYSKRNERDLAMADFDKAIAINPKFANAYNNRGIVYGRKGEIDKAIADFSSAIEINPKFAWPYNNRGTTYGRKGEHDKAIADFDRAVEIDPKYAQAYANRGSTIEKMGDNERAIADFRKVLDLPATHEADRQRHEIVRARIARLTQPPPPRAAVAPQGPQRVALVIGISNYAHTPVLKNPRNDATATAAALRRLGFSQVVEHYDLTREQMGKALKEFGDLVEGAEWAVVFFAGHGMEMNGVTYLIPADAALKRDTHVADETISLTQVQTKVDAASKLGLVILDSCRNNPLLDRMARSAGSTRSISAPRGLAVVEPEGNVLVAYSAKHGTVALDGTGQNSPFTEALVKHIETPGLEINFLFRKIRDDVRTKTARRQEPFLYGSLSSEELFFKAAAR